MDSRSFFMHQTLFERKSIVCLATQWVHFVGLTPQPIHFVCGSNFIIYFKKQFLLRSSCTMRFCLGESNAWIRNRLRCVVWFQFLFVVHIEQIVWNRQKRKGTDNRGKRRTPIEWQCTFQSFGFSMRRKIVFQFNALQSVWMVFFLCTRSMYANSHVAVWCVHDRCAPFTPLFFVRLWSI